MKQTPGGTNSEYNQHVVRKYQLYNSLFLTLPLGGVKDVGILIPILAETCRTKLQQGETPKKIIEQFLTEQLNTKDQIEKFDFLFRVIQFVERQVVLIDALEDATFEALNNLNGPGSISSLLIQAKQEKKINTLLEKINNFSIRPVLTAHPTQFYPGRVLASIANYLRRNGYNPNSNNYDRDGDIWNSIYAYNHADNYVMAVLELKNEIKNQTLTEGSTKD